MLILTRIKQVRKALSSSKIILQENVILKMSVGCGRGCSGSVEKNGSTFSEMRDAMPFFKNKFFKTKKYKHFFYFAFYFNALFFSQQDIIVFSRVS